MLTIISNVTFACFHVFLGSLTSFYLSEFTSRIFFACLRFIFQKGKKQLSASNFWLYILWASAANNIKYNFWLSGVCLGSWLYITYSPPKILSHSVSQPLLKIKLFKYFTHYSLEFGPKWCELQFRQTIVLNTLKIWS